MSEEFFGLVERAGNDMNADEFTDAPGSDGTRFGRGFHRSNIATHENRDVAIARPYGSGMQTRAARYRGIGAAFDE